MNEISDKKTRTRSHQFAVWIVVVISTLAIAGYVFFRIQAGHKPVGPPEKATIAFAMPYVLIEVAQMRGYFKEEGLNMTPLLRSHGKAALKDVLDGTADFAGVAETPAMFAIMKGEKISIIATIQTSRKNNAIVARKDRGILTPGDLKGRKIATTRGTTGHFFMDVFLTTHGISKKNMEVSDLKPEELPNVLVNGRVDAVSAFGFSLVQAQKKLGEKGITFYDEEIYTQNLIIVARQEYISRNPEAVKKLLRGLLKAEDFTSENPGEAQKIVADFSRMDVAAVRAIWPDDLFQVTLDQSLVLALEDESEWAIEAGLTDAKKIPNYLSFIYIKGLETVKPKAVRILR